jgi:C4-dicarboxylate-specific signal transduction histidine kinase
VRDVELVQRSAGGREFTAVFSAAPLRDPTGRVTGAVAVGRDITVQRRVERVLKDTLDELESRVQERTAELQQAYDRLRVETEERERVEAQLRQAQKMEALGTLSGGIAHDLNNILAAIVGFTELVQERLPKGSQQMRHAKRVLEAGLRGRGLVKQMLTFSRKTEQEKKPLRLSSVVREAMKPLRASIPSTISVRVKVDGASDLVFADSIQMQQVLMNLCTNAAHAMQEKGGILDVELSAFSASGKERADGMKPGPYMRLIVRDTGVGYLRGSWIRSSTPSSRRKSWAKGRVSASPSSTAS